MAAFKGANKDKSLSFEYIPVSREDLVRGKGLCDRCFEMSPVFYYTYNYETMTHNCVCADCVLELDPPKWELTMATTTPINNNQIEPMGTYDLWDNTHMRQERTMTLKEAVNCGWFIRKIEETKSLLPKRTIRKIDLEYYGKLLCARFFSHYEKLGLDGMNFCRSPFCEFMFTNIYDK